MCEKCDLILEWAEDHPNFDTTFVESVRDFYEEKGEHVGNQEAALDRIIDGWNIDI